MKFLRLLYENYIADSGPKVFWTIPKMKSTKPPFTKNAFSDLINVTGGKGVKNPVGGKVLRKKNTMKKGELGKKKKTKLKEARLASTSAKESSFSEFKQLSETGEGLVLLGAGGELSDWINGVTKMLDEEGIATSSNPAVVWNGAYYVTSSGGRTDLLLMFGDNTLNVGKLAMWRLQFGDASWLSDYVNNYADHN